MPSPLDELQVRTEVKLEWRGHVIMDEELASVLYEINRRGSMLAGCKALGVPYSRIWERISNVERILGAKLVEHRRGGAGGGGARLTEVGKKLLSKYLQAAGMEKHRLKPKAGEGDFNDIIISGSHDIALEHIVNILKKRRGDLGVETFWIGSIGGLASLMLGYSHIAGVHLVNPETGEYNVHQLRRYSLEEWGIVIRGYQREIGITSRRDMRITSFSELLDRRVRIVNRNKGSGTRLLFDYLLRQEAAKRGIPPGKVAGMLTGYEYEVNTHLEVARAVASGRADAGLTIRQAAEAYGLEFTTVTWEWYDFVTTKQSYKLPQVRSFFNVLSSRMFRDSIRRLKGYRVSSDTGRVIYAPHA